MNAHELKALQVQLTKAQAEEKAEKENLTAAEGKYKAAKARTAALKARIESAKQSEEPMVTEHALLRYIERVYGVDLEEIKNQILTPTTIKAIKTLGSGKYPLQAGGKAVVKGLNVISVID